MKIELAKKQKKIKREDRLNRKQEKKQKKQIRVQKYEEKHIDNKYDLQYYLQIIPPINKPEHDNVILPLLKKIRERFTSQKQGREYKTKIDQYIVECIWLDNNFTYEDILHNLTRVYDGQKNAFKINISYGYVFERIMEEQRYDYFIGTARDDKNLLDEPVYIGNHKDFKMLLEKLSLQYLESFNQSKYVRDTKTRAIGIYQLFIKVYQTKNPIRANENLPDIILNSKAVYPALNVDTKEDDKLCF